MQSFINRVNLLTRQPTNYIFLCPCPLPFAVCQLPPITAKRLLTAFTAKYIPDIHTIKPHCPFLPAKTCSYRPETHAFIALALNLTYMAIAFNSWLIKQEYVILSQIIFV